MGDGEKSGSGRRNDWPIRLAGGLGGAAGAALALLWRPNLGGVWQGSIGFCIMTGVGLALGQLAGRLLFRRPPGDPPATPEDQPQQPGPP